VSGVLTGRDAELAVVAEMLGAGGPDASKLVLVEGGAGIGKSALLRAARDQAAALGFTVLSATADRLEQDFAFGMVRQLFERLLYADPRRAAELLSGPAALAAAVFGLGGPDAADADRPVEEVTFATLHGLYWLAADLAADHRLLITMDDLQWADPPSLRWLRYLARRIEGLPIVVIVARRGDRPATAEESLEQLFTHRLRLNGIGLGGTVAIGNRVFSEPGDTGFWLACQEATGGNPFLLHALLRSCRAAGVRPTTDAAAQIGEFGPPEVAALAHGTIAELGEPAERLVTALSVLGDGADLATLAAVAGLDPAMVAEVAGALAGTWLVQAGEQALSFAHAIVRSAILLGVPPATRADLHLRAARVLHGRSAPVERVAAHLLAIPANGDDWVLPTLRAASADAVRRGAPESAARYLRRALDEPLDETHRAGLLVELGLVEQHIDRKAAVGHFAAALAGPLDATERARTVINLAHAQFNIDVEDGEAANEALRRARDALAATHPALTLLVDVERIYLSLGIAAPASVLPRLAELQLADGLGTPAEGPLAGLLAYRALMAGTDREAAVDLARRALRHNDSHGDDWFVRNRALFTLIIAGELAEAMALCDAAAAEARRRGLADGYALVLNMRAEANYRLGRLVECMADIEGSGNIDLAATGEAYLSAPMICRFMGVLLAQGRVGRAAEVLAGTLALPVPPNARVNSWVLLARAELRVAQGRVREGLADLRECGQLLLDTGHLTAAWLPWRSQAALAHWMLGEQEQARASAEQEVDLARKWGSPGCTGAALRALGIVTPGTAGLDHLREAVDILAGSPARLEHARALAALGTALRKAHHLAEAREVLREAFDLASDCAATGLAEQARAELRAAGARPRTRTFTGVESLTPTERRVAAIAAHGLTNREIAQQLFVGLRTVEIHLTNAYRKLNVTGRPELARFFDQSAVPGGPASRTG
jgi:DNA-binding CsgD family transcriptional regulator